ncbi:nesprin-2-like isoform X1 [Homalodisca vitripennis]|nr:nesprin-2-like isoform X1 [Homalodisca vitripennis]
MLCYQLEDKLRLGQMFDKRQERFLTWTTGVGRRLESLAVSCGEPEEVLRRLETELEAEVVLRRREVEWLRGAGAELVEAEGLEATPRRAEVKARVSAVEDAWDKVQQMTSARANKLRQIIEGMSVLEQRMEVLRSWLHCIEVQLATPVILETCTEAGLNKCLSHHDALTKDIEQHSGPVGDVLNHCEVLLNDCDSANVQLNTDGISTAMQLLERRWKNVCVVVTERKARLMSTWRLLQEVLRLCEEQTEWLQTQTDTLDNVQRQTDCLQLQALPTLIGDVEKVITEVECRRPALDLLQSSYTTLATQSSLDNLTAEVRGRITEWSTLRTRADELLAVLRSRQQRWRTFTETQGAAVLALTDVDVRLTQIDLLETDNVDDSDLDTHKNKLKRLLVLKKELESHGDLLKTADLLGLEVMNGCVPSDVPKVQQLVDEYQLLWKDITERMKQLIDATKEECRKRNVVNEEVQVETLKFETDTSVQVNTLPAPLLRRDAYIYELQTAIRECNANLDSLAALDKLTTQSAGKCVAACQSSVDLVRHLSGLLVEQCGLTPEEACSKQVETLVTRYQQLLAQKQATDREDQEARSAHEESYTFYCIHESGRFTCPLCTRRNWKQLDNDLWRLQKWLDYAEGTQATQQSPPSNINQLEEVIQDYREFLLDLDSHKSLVVSLNIVGKHLAEHTEDEARAHEMTERLAEINRRWDAVCNTAATWETRLQTALLQNPEFHDTIEELVQWLEQTEVTIQQMEPVDVADGLSVIETKYNKFKDLRHDLEVCEPRVLSLQEAASHLLRHRQTEADTSACERLTHLRLRLQSLTRLTDSYLVKLGTVLGKDPLTHTSLATLSHELLDQAAGGTVSSRSSTDQLHSNCEGIVDTSVLARGYRFLGRVVRASLPIQALMLVLLGVASLVPITEEDFSCGISRTFGPTLRYINGPPPM